MQSQSKSVDGLNEKKALRAMNKKPLCLCLIVRLSMNNSQLIPYLRAFSSQNNFKNVITHKNAIKKSKILSKNTKKFLTFAFV